MAAAVPRRERGLDLLVQLDTLFIEEQIDERTKYAHWSRSGAERSAADVVRATLAVSEYEHGQYIAALMTLEKDLAIAEATLVTAQNMLNHEQSLRKRGYRSQLDVEQKQLALRRAELSVELKQTEIEVLKKFTRRERLESLKGNLKAIKANHKANVERAEADASRRDRAVIEHGHCEIKAEREGRAREKAAEKEAKEEAERKRKELEVAEKKHELIRRQLDYSTEGKKGVIDTQRYRIGKAYDIIINKN